MSFPSQYPGDLRDAFHEALYAYRDGDEFEPSVYCDNDYDQNRWLAMDPKERLMWIARQLQDCMDTLPGETCVDLDIPQGSTYGQACMKILEGEVTLAESV